MSAPKHKLAQDHARRPLAFKTVKELQDKIDEYFAYCENRIRTTVDKDGNEKTYNWPAPYTMSGLAYYLDVDRRTIINYTHKEPYFPAIARARARVEQDMETRLYESRTPQGQIFGLKNNFTWIDESKQQIDANISGKTELTPEAAAILAKASRSDDVLTEPD